MERLAEASETEIRINFALNCKCRATVTLRSLCTTSPLAFKVQTSSPNKFLVNPPSGIVPPLSHSSFQVILKPQSHLPPSFPRSPSDRFLVKIAPFLSNASNPIPSHAVNSWFSSLPPSVPTQNLKLKVAFVGRYLLRHAVGNGDLDSVRNLIKRQRSLLADLSPDEAESLLRVATELVNPDGMVHLLLEDGLRVDQGFGSDGWDELHVAAASDRTDEIVGLLRVKPSWPLDRRDHTGRTPLHLAVEKGSIRCARVLVEGGGDVNATCNDSRTPLFIAAANGDRRMVGMLVEMGADPTITDDRGRSALNIARDEGHKEIVEIMEQGEEVIAAARLGDAKKLEMLLKRGASVHYRDQYGLTALHVAAMKGHREMVTMLTEAGLDLDCEDEEGHVPLHMAVESGDQETIQVLVNKGVHVNSPNKKGATPLYMATILGYDAIAEFLVSKGAISCFPVILR